ncbi:MAG: helix-hairpin-helix domain-containing protein [Myxococcota bacterium]
MTTRRTESAGDEPMGGVHATAEAWAALADGLRIGNLEVDTDPLEDLTEELLLPSEELGRVSRRIAAQYAEIVTSFAASAFRGDVRKATIEQVGNAIEALLRLASAAGDHTQSALLDELLGLVQPATTGRLNSRPRQKALAALREWIPRFAATLEDEDRERLTRLVVWDTATAPLMDELSELKGIGPKRLQRLYSAGLFTVDAVVGADPDDVAAVTGLPRDLAARVVEATGTYAHIERRRCMEVVRERTRRLRNLLVTLPGTGDPELTRLAREALREVEETFRHFGEEGE